MTNYGRSETPVLDRYSSSALETLKEVTHCG
jgi:hypothetical protein